MPSDTARGFSLLELMIAIGITMAVVATVFAMLDPARGAFQTQLEAADAQQRLRVAVDAITRDLTAAGAGAFAGHAGPLRQFFPPILPYRQGIVGDDPPGTFRTDTVTLLSVPATAAQTTLAADLMPGALTLQAAAGSACPGGTNLCGFAPGMTVLVYDDTGNVATFMIEAVADAAAQLTLTARPADSAPTIYPRGSNIVEARIDVYGLKADAPSRTFQLIHYDGSANGAVPAVDHVVGLAFEFYGDPPAGEAGGLVQLTADQLSDGPWRPDAANANRWDADLLRIRMVAVTVRLEVAAGALRGPAGILFTNGGTSRDANRWVPDLEIRFQVSPRNLNPEGE